MFLRCLPSIIGKGSDRFRKVERFVQYYFDRFETLRKPPYHPKWKEINLAAKVPGWSRYFVAEEMLGKSVSKAQTEATGFAPTASALDVADGRGGSRQGVERKGLSGIPGMEEEEREVIADVSFALL